MVVRQWSDRRMVRAATILHPFFKGLDHEEVWILIVKGKEPVTSMKICSGDQASVAIDKKRIAKEVLLNDGDGLILFHNHPSCNPQPSLADITETGKLNSMLRTLDLHLIDHIIFAGKSYFSFAEERIIKL